MYFGMARITSIANTVDVTLEFVKETGFDRNNMTIGVRYNGTKSSLSLLSIEEWV